MHRLRVGDYRIIYHMKDDQGVVKVLLVANRRDAYEQLERMTR
ncbi:type II toxin-antitoxin system RelE/ParE family toxin [bacterium]|nr:type II toxin-antitoxin system RelE/ParE family toxin [bacterium]